MKIPRNLSGREVVQVLVKKMQYNIVHQRGSHIVLETEIPSHQRIVIPDHKYIRIGTLNALINKVAKHKGIDKDELITLF